MASGSGGASAADQDALLARRLQREEEEAQSLAVARAMQEAEMRAASAGASAGPHGMGRGAAGGGDWRKRARDEAEEYYDGYSGEESDDFDGEGRRGGFYDSQEDEYDDGRYRHGGYPHHGYRHQPYGGGAAARRDSVDNASYEELLALQVSAGCCPPSIRPFAHASVTIVRMHPLPPTMGAAGEIAVRESETGDGRPVLKFALTQLLDEVPRNALRIRTSQRWRRGAERVAESEACCVAQERMGGNVKRGATKQQLANLPSFRVPKVPKVAGKGKGKKKAAAAEEEGAGASEAAAVAADKETCCVCMDEHKPGQMMRTLPCMHVFHLKCIDKWLKTSLECPVCKSRIV